MSAMPRVAGADDPCGHCGLGWSWTSPLLDLESIERDITSTDVGEKESLAAAEEANDAVSAAVGVGSSIARISNTAIISSISLPAIFQISLTFEMPFAYVAQHATNDVAFR